MKSILLSAGIRTVVLFGLALIPGVIPNGKAVQCTDALYKDGTQYCVQCYVEGPGGDWYPVGDTQWWQRM